jgi:hypothetical protein
MIRVRLNPAGGTKTYAANIIASVIFAGLCLLAIWHGPFTLKTQLGLGAILIVVILICWFLWQEQESCRWSMKFWFQLTVGSLVWSLVGLWIGSLVYHVSFLRLVRFDMEAWDSLGSMGPFAIGPVALVFNVASIIRRAILDALNRRLSQPARMHAGSLYDRKRRHRSKPARHAEQVRKPCGTAVAGSRLPSNLGEGPADEALDHS